MKKKVIIDAQARKDVGKGASRRLRRLDRVPGIVYGSNKTPASITMEHKAVARALENESFYTSIFDLSVDGVVEQVILKDLQRHPFKPRIMHMDLQRISADEKLTIAIPVHFSGADVAPGVKLSGGMIAHHMAEIEVRCLPKDLPEFIEVDLSNLAINQGVNLSELNLGEGIEIVALTHGDDKVIANVYMPRTAAEEENVVAEGSEAKGNKKNK